jgi:hypothetical protein
MLPVALQPPPPETPNALTASTQRLPSQWPDAQASLSPSTQLSCSPSPGSNAPSFSCFVQACAERLQNSLLAQSLSTQQSPPMHTSPLVLHLPDWQLSAASSTEQGPSPSACPHMPLPPQTEEAQTSPLSQLTLLLETHTPRSALQRPVLQASLTPSTQPACSPSLGRGAPAAMRSRHVCSERSQ